MSYVKLLSTRVGRTADGVELRLRSPWYRSLPLSCIDVELTIDGAQVASDRLRLCVNEHDYALDELGDQYEEFWFVLDQARLRVADVASGDHEVTVRLGVRVPYLFDEETGDVLQLWPSATETVTVPERACA